MKKRGRRRIEEADHRTSFLKSVERTLDVLESLSKSHPVGITEVADSMGIGTSTAHRILATLTKKGFAVQEPETGRYTLGHMAFQLAKPVTHIMEPVKYVRPYLEELCKKAGENTVFGIVTPGKDGTSILAEEISDKTVIAKSILFERYPLHVCPCGKAYLLTLDDKQLKTTLSKNRMIRFTKYTPVSFSALKKQLTQFQRIGYTLSKDEFSIGFSGMASGISANGDGKFAGAIMIAGPSFRFTDRNIKCWGKLLSGATAKLGLEFKARGIE